MDNEIVAGRGFSVEVTSVLAASGNKKSRDQRMVPA